MPTKKKATQKQKQKQSQVVNIHIGDKGGKKKRGPRVVRQMPKQPIVVNVSTPQMSIPSFENRTFIDGAKFSSSVPINELLPVKVPEKVAEKIPVKVPVPTSNMLSTITPNSFMSISVPSPSPFSYISPVSSVSMSPVSSLSPLQDSYPELPFSEQEKEQVERKKMGMEERLTRIKNNLLREQNERNLMGMEDLSSRLQNDMFSQEKENNLMSREDVRTQGKKRLPRRTANEMREANEMGSHDERSSRNDFLSRQLTSLNQGELHQYAQSLGVNLQNTDGKKRNMKQLINLIKELKKFSKFTI